MTADEEFGEPVARPEDGEGMTDKPRRFRFSLITLLVAVNVAGMLVWANVHDDSESDAYFLRGWPIQYQEPSPLAKMLNLFYDGELTPSASVTVWKNIAICGVILLSATMLTEFLVRRIRKAKRHDG